MTTNIERMDAGFYTPIIVQYDEAETVLRMALRHPSFDPSAERAALVRLAREIDLRDGQTCGMWWTDAVRRFLEDTPKEPR